MGKRTLTGAIVLLITALFVASRYLTVYFFDAFVMAISFIACYEILKANASDQRKCSKAYIYLSLSHVYLLYLAYSPFIAKTLLQTIIFQALLFFIYFLVSMILEIIYLNKLKDETIEPEEMLLSTKKLMGIMLFPNTLLGTLYGINSFNVGSATVILGLVFGISMFTDVFAYFIGSLFHKGNFANQISPKKSISGAIGGLFGGIILTAIVYILLIVVGLYNPFTSIPKNNLLLYFIILGVFGSIATEAGDLVASSIKRKYALKDFGKLLPGHGGVMDRVDGLMFCSAIAYILAIIILV